MIPLTEMEQDRSRVLHTNMEDSMKARGRFKVESVREFRGGKAEVELLPVGYKDFPEYGPEFDVDLNPVREETEAEREFGRLVSEVYEEGISFGRGGTIIETEAGRFEPGQEVEVTIEAVEPLEWEGEPEEATPVPDNRPDPSTSGEKA